MAANWLLSDVSVSAGGKKDALLLDEVTIPFKAATITLLVGQNGAGKSTLLETVAGLRELQSGVISLGDEALWTSKRRKKLNRHVLLKLGIALQQSESQWFASTVLEEFRFSLRPYHLETDELNRRIESALEATGLQRSLLERDPWTLSGGQQRRLALACLLACEPDWLLLDEPTAGLDADGVRRLRAVLAAHKAAGRGAVVATHDLEALLPLADAVVVVGGGSVREAAPAEAALMLASAAPQALRAGALLREAAALPPEEPAAERQSGAEWLEPREMAAAIVSHLSKRAARGEEVKPSRNMDDEHDMEQNHHHGLYSHEQKAGHQTRSWLRSDRYDPRVLVVSYFMLSACLFMVNSLQGAGLAALVTGAAVAPFWSLIRSWLPVVRGFAIITGILILIAGLTFSPLSFQWMKAETTAIRLLQLLLVMVIGMPLLGLMTPLRLQRAIQQTFGWTARLGIPIHSFGLLITLIFRFIPLLTREWGRFAKIANARGKSVKRIGAVPVSLLRVILIPYIRAVLRVAEAMADALESRGYGHMPSKPTYGFRVKAGRFDFFMLGAACIGSIILSFIGMIF